MLSGDLAAFLSETLQIKPSLALDRWKLLRSAGLLSKNGRGPRSGARMAERDALNGLLALLIERRVGDDVAGNVRAVRALALCNSTELPSGLTDGLPCFAAQTAGEALEGLLSDLRTGRMTAWAGGEAVDLNVNFDLRGHSVLISVWLPKRHDLDVRSAMRIFGPDYESKQTIARNATIKGEVFAQLADMLGPLPPESS